MTANRLLKRVRRIGQTGALDADLHKIKKADAVGTGMERSVYDENLTDFLTGVVQEWIISNPGRSVDHTNLATILPEALDEFMWKHLDDT